MTTETMSSVEYQVRYGRKAFIKPTKVPNQVKLGRSALSEPIVSDSIEKGEGYIKITLAGLMKGLNGSKGLMQSHWSVSRKHKENILNRIKSLNPPQFKGSVIMTYTRYTSKLMDWDNMCSTSKFYCDGLKNAKVIEDDSPKYIVEFIPKQVKCRRKDARTEILIKQIKS